MLSSATPGDESQQPQAPSSPPINRVFNDEELQAIQNYYDLQASLFSDEMCDLLYIKFGKVFTEKQVDRARKKLNLTSKLMEQKSREQNDLLREYWRQVVLDRIDIHPTYMFMFVDETHLTPSRRNIASSWSFQTWQTSSHLTLGLPQG
jgi:hypothetical protein